MPSPGSSVCLGVVFVRDSTLYSAAFHLSAYNRGLSLMAVVRIWDVIFTGAKLCFEFLLLLWLSF